jgi:hypothetical protein
MTELSTHLVLSTAHLSEAVSRSLLDMSADTEDRLPTGDWRDHLVHCEYRYGHWIRLLGDAETRKAAIAKMPDCLAACLAHAESYGASWILFDRDGPELDDLETYEW